MKSTKEKGNETFAFLVKTLKIGITDIMPSAIPILIWTILSILYDNTGIAKGFSVTYPYQFIFMCLCEIFVVGQVKSEAKCGKVGDKSNSGVLVWVTASSSVIIVSIICRHGIINWFHEDVNEYTPILIYGIIMLALDYTVYYTVLIWKYEDKLKKAFGWTLWWYMTRLCSVVVVSLIIREYKTGLYWICIVQTLVLLIFIVKNIRIKRFCISILDGFKYTVNCVPNNVFICMIYIFGYNRASTFPGYFEAYNIEALCTDIQWDVLSSGIDTAVTTEICTSGTSKKKKYIIASMIYSVILYISSAVMIIIYTNIFRDVDAYKVWVIYLIECSIFPLYAIMYCIEAEIVINKPLVIMAVSSIVKYCARLSITTFIKSPYAISFGVVVSLTMGLTQVILIYKFIYLRKRRKKHYEFET